MLLKLDIGLYISFLFLFSSALFVTYMHTYIHSYIHTSIHITLHNVKESNFTTLDDVASCVWQGWFDSLLGDNQSVDEHISDKAIKLQCSVIV